MPQREQARIDRPPFNWWTVPGGAVWAEFHRIDDQVTIRFPGLADFQLPRGDAAPLCWPAPGLTGATAEHLFLNQVLPLMLARSGRLTFHASAVATARGAIAFVGSTGRGKSTLTAACATAGFPFLTDDGLSVIERDGGYFVEPSHPSLRLWDDSRDALVTRSAETADPVSYTHKWRLLAGEALPFADRPHPLRAAYFLGEADVDAARISPLHGAAKLLEWTKHSFLLDIDDGSVLDAHFSSLVDFSNAVPSFVLDYPRSYALLDDVRQAIMRHVTGDAAR